MLSLNEGIVKIKNLILLCMAALLFTGCSHQAVVGGDTTTWSDTSAVTIQKGKAITFEQRYSDPLDYYHNGFDDLYFN